MLRGSLSEGIDEPDGPGRTLGTPETGDPNQSAHSAHLTTIEPMFEGL
jgi:hypothetical protein